MSGFRVLGISWIGIGSDSYDGTLALFRDILGLEVETSVERQAILKTAADQQVEVFGREGPGKVRNTPPAIGFEVDDLDAARDALIAGGVELVGEPGSWDSHRWQYFRTPDGFMMSIKTSSGGPT